MSTAVGKMAPMAMVLAVAVWCCWPYLEGPQPRQGFEQPGKLPRIALPLLSPTISPVCQRDPFQPPHAEQTASTEGSQPATAERLQNAPEAREEIADPFSGLTLNATYIGGSSRLAMINGQLCEQGQPLANSGTTTEPCIVAQIGQHKVLLWHHGRTVELTYRGSAPSAAGSSPPQVTGRATVREK